MLSQLFLLSCFHSASGTEPKQERTPFSVIKTSLLNGVYVKIHMKRKKKRFLFNGKKVPLTSFLGWLLIRLLENTHATTFVWSFTACITRKSCSPGESFSPNNREIAEGFGSKLLIFFCAAAASGPKNHFYRKLALMHNYSLVEMIDATHWKD